MVKYCIIWKFQTGESILITCVIYFNPHHYRQLSHITLRHPLNSPLQFSNFGTNHCMFCNLLFKSTVGFKCVCMIYTLFNNTLWKMSHFDKKKNLQRRGKVNVPWEKKKKLHNHCLSKLLKIFFAAEYEGCGVFSPVPRDDGCVICWWRWRRMWDHFRSQHRRHASPGWESIHRSLRILRLSRWRTSGDACVVRPDPMSPRSPELHKTRASRRGVLCEVRVDYTTNF